ncbi:NADH-quinone oxidoreductase subunit N [Andreprevotia lacus DSM 23236]|jgi:NADH-quinone oxidoreductase subunit N|uniref:NADH-quinone oxidoreductase subunit N n=1 Tax=Andreprevotia lacus DSM 23236 TaxID=1121001 RepID=A0A1W1WZQ1_9NEIS|nr:NADH-quinone oxidoreductase subunit NuoN [Andreprevotia lacus]SMC17202.1 NADH-quinone oxidoreductase subunit N [Andreprevotia lacus DSM 23236]
MTWTSLNAGIAYPEIFLLIAACAILLIDVFVSDAKRGITHGLTLAALAVTGAILYSGYIPQRVTAFSGQFVADPMAAWAKGGILIGVALALIYGRSYAAARQMYRGELYTLTLFATLGMMIMTSAINFLLLYVGLELLSLSLYALVALRRDSANATEAAMKYFVLGALASGMLLYGMSMVYGATGSLDVVIIAQKIATQAANPTLLVFGLVFIVAGIAFKLGAVPFHMWVPDVYQGAPTPIAQLIGTAPKLAAFAFVMRLLAEALGLAGIDLSQIRQQPMLLPSWSSMLMVLAVASLVIGNLAAIAQTNIKRMFAYSTISHMGFLLLGILVANEVGYSASFFYAFTYVLTAAAGFGMVQLLSREGFEADTIDAFKGLAKRSPWFAFMMLMVLFSMAGIPVFVGFFAKLSVLQALLNHAVLVPGVDGAGIDIDHSGLVWVAVVAVLMSLVGAFYYLRVVKVMFFDEPTDTAPISACWDVRIILSLNCLLLLALGLVPGYLLAKLGEAVKLSSLVLF